VAMRMDEVAARNDAATGAPAGQRAESEQ
jgi:hypothetical protein